MLDRNYSHPTLTEFAAIASAFCDTVANVSSHPAGAQLEQIHRLLPRVYFAALELPDTSVLFTDSGDSDEHEHEHDSERVVVAPPKSLELLAEFLGLHRYYREVFDPYAESSDGEVTGDLIDDLGDIYRDLLHGLLYWHSGRPGKALWEWRFNFQSHWANHVTSALRAIFALSAWRDVPWPTGSSGSGRSE